MLLAAASLDVTPPAGHPLDGYAAREGVADGAADPLRATIVWLSTAGDPGVAWLCLDAVAVSTDLARRLAGAVPGVPDERVVVCASHTHSGPSGWSGSIHPFLPAVRSPELVEALVAAVEGVVLERRRVRALWCSPDAPGVGANRHRPDGPHDTSAGVLALHGPEGVEALLVDYACHPTVLGPDNLSWSADWPGAARRSLPGVVAFLQGAAGDVSPRFVRRGRDTTEATRLGDLLATPILRALPTAQPLPAPDPRTRQDPVAPPTARPLSNPAPRSRQDTVALPAVRAVSDPEPRIGQDSGALPAARPVSDPGPGIGQGGVVLPAVPFSDSGPRIRRGTVALPVRGFPGRGEVEVRLAEAREAVGRDPCDRVAQSVVEGARGLAALGEAALPPVMELPISVVRLGGVAWAHVPVELFTTLAAQIKERSPFPVTRVVGYTDGYFGYVADAAAHAVGGYEALMSYFEAATGELLVEAVLDLLRREFDLLLREFDNAR
ncbi:hypothetical protein [Nonomuraea sediminis]|uniref:hypothetical protein n=1 Tax=Nonomuraea sediminis TaxID=2835864 RepID=UPI001BDD2AF6|nr:hypothetical protein [Nonomuraea sediminis]